MTSDFKLELPKDVEKEIPFLMRGPVKDFLKFLNSRDLNKDGKSDVAQIAPVVIKALPYLTGLASLIDWEAVVQFLLDKFAKDKVLAAAKVEELKAVGIEIKDALPKQETA